LFVVALVASSQPKKKVDGDEQQARFLFGDGQKAYDLGEFERALQLYSDAYKLKPLPGFLFNIGQCHRQLGNFERAEFFYGRFIDNSNPDAPNTKLARELLADVAKKRVEKEAAQRRAADEKVNAEAKAPLEVPLVPVLVPPEPSLPVSPPVADVPVTQNPAFWVVVGAVVVAVATGATVGIVLSRPQTRMTSLPDIDGRR
jgi:hypothetical protein